MTRLHRALYTNDLLRQAAKRTGMVMMSMAVQTARTSHSSDASVGRRVAASVLA